MVCGEERNLVLMLRSSLKLTISPRAESSSSFKARDDRRLRCGEPLSATKIAASGRHSSSSSSGSSSITSTTTVA